MLWAVTVITFLSTFLLVLAMIFAFTPTESDIATRMKRMMNPVGPAPQERYSDKQKERVRSFLAKIGKLMPAAAEAQASRAQLMMMRAGYRSADAILAIRGVKVILPLALVLITLLTGFYRRSPLLILAIVAIV